MLAGDFYTITKLDASDGAVNAELEINADHKIFEGHFPGQPVVPGVCMMQMIKEVLEEAIGKKTRLIESDYAKFLAMIDPQKTENVAAEITYNESNDGTFDIVSALKNEKTVFLKYKAILKVI